MCTYILRKETNGYFLYDISNNTIYFTDSINDDPYNEQNYKTLSRTSTFLPENYFKTHLGKFIDNSKNGLDFGAPETVFLETTKRCNLRCGHCFNSSGLKDNAELSLTDIQNLINEFDDIGVFTVKITGGEPFCRDDIIDILKYLDKKAINYIVFSNGTSITKKHIEELKHLKHLLKLRISIDGIEETNDSIRGKGSYRKAIDTVKCLTLNDIPCEINFTITKQNYKQISLLAKCIQKEELSCKINIGFVKIAGRAKDNSEEYYFTDENIGEAILEVKTQLKNTDCIKPFYILEPIYYEIFGKSFGCPAARLTTTIKCNGDVYPCGLFSSFEEFRCGNIIYEKFQDIWNSTQMNIFRNLPESLDCIQCEFYKKTCTGACRGNAFNYFNNICGHDINCLVYQVDFNN